MPTQEPEPVAALARESAPGSETRIAGYVPPEPVPRIVPVLIAAEPAPHTAPVLVAVEPDPDVEPVLVAAEPLLHTAPVLLAADAVPVTRGPSTIERFHAAQAEIDLDALSVTPSPPLAIEEPADESVLLNEETESEIEVSAEAETLVEASVAPVTYQPPEEIAVAGTAPLDEIAAQLRDGAWRSAMSDDDGKVTRLAPALIQTPPSPKRRLSMHRIGLVVAGLGAVVAVVYSARLAPGTSYVPTQAATPTPITRNTVETLQGAAALTAAVPDKTRARSVETQAEVQAPQPITRAVETPANNELQSTLAPAVTPAKVATHTDTRPAAPAAPARETMAPPVAQASRLPLEAARPCTPAIEALGLCTREASQEGK